MGWWSLVGAGAPVFGVVLGGPLVAAFGWRSIFLIQAPVAACAWVAAAIVLHETPIRPREPLDLAGAGWLAVSTVSLLLALSEGRSWGWTSPAILLLLAACPFAFAAFVRAERRAISPVLPLDLFRRPNFGASLAAQFASNFAYMGGFFITPILMQNVFGWGIAATGYAMLCRPLTFSLSSPAWGYLTTRTGERLAAMVGTSLVATSMVVFALAAHGERLPLVFCALVLSGLGLGAASPSLIASVANTVGDADLGVANAAQAMVAQVGVSVGIQTMVVVQSSGSGPSAYSLAYLVGGVVAACGVVAASFVRSLERAPAAT
jgi:MFS family permease